MKIKPRITGREMRTPAMRSPSWSMLITLALCAQSLVSWARAEEIGTNPQFSFDKAAYEKAMRQTFDGKVMGYATVLIKNGQVASEVAGGRGRNTVDGDVKMTTTIPAHIGSTIKFVSGV